MALESAANPPVEYPAAQNSRPYQLFFQIGIVVILMAVLFTAVLADMAHDWWIEPAWSQGMLLPPLALYIAWDPA